MQNQYFVKSFSKGQITVPKELRKKLNIGDDFWLKIYISNNKIVAEPQIDATPEKATFANKKIKTVADLANFVKNFKPVEWDMQDYKRTRQELEKRAKKYDY